jgi:phosphate/sulfate permease
METMQLFDIVFNILNQPFIQYPLAIACIAIGALSLSYFIYSIIHSYIAAKKTGKPVSWIKLFDDIRWTLYDFNERDNEYTMSLPRLMYFVSGILIIYVVLADKAVMLTPLLGFNISAMASYTSKKYIESKEKIKTKEIDSEETEVENETEVLKTAVNNLMDLKDGIGR